MKLTFLGAAGTVTGSKYLVEDGKRRILVDCGLFQGSREDRARNWGAPSFDPAKLDAVLLTHAHLDHSGYIPVLIKAGFRGRIYCTAATRDLCAILLPDSGHIQEEDAEQANRHGYSRHRPALPLYTAAEAEAALDYFHPVKSGVQHDLGDGMRFSFHYAGHIMGAAFIRLVADDGTSVLFSGDIGRLRDPVMKPPATIQSADYIVVESTYGDRLHDPHDPAECIGAAIGRTVARGGTVLIPAFAVGRAQQVLYYIHHLKQAGRIPMELPVFLDSPMAINATNLMAEYMSAHRLSHDLCAAVCGVARYVSGREESRTLDTRPEMPKIIISASGMMTGGRILHHLKHYAGDRRNTILMTGYQAEGTRGGHLVRGARELKIHGSVWPVEAEVVQVDNMSAHADAAEIIEWLEGFTATPRRVFVTHGEPGPAAALAARIKERFGWQADVAEYRQEVEL